MGYSINSTRTDKRSKKNLSGSASDVSGKIDSSEDEFINYNLKESHILKGSKADATTNNLGVSVTNNILHHLTLIDPSRLNSVIARAVDGSKFKLEWYHKNYLDHVYAVSDDTGDILEHYRYTAFGEVQIYKASGNQVAQTQIDNHILWNTRRRDEVTGYYMYKFRHYSAELGRWPSRDPIEENGGVNLYGFVGNDGVNNWDMLGLWNKADLLKCLCNCEDGNKNKYLNILKGVKLYKFKKRLVGGKEEIVDGVAAKNTKGDITVFLKSDLSGGTLCLTAIEEIIHSKQLNANNEDTYEQMVKDEVEAKLEALLHSNYNKYDLYSAYLPIVGYGGANFFNIVRDEGDIDTPPSSFYELKANIDIKALEKIIEKYVRDVYPDEAGKPAVVTYEGTEEVDTSKWECPK